MKRIIFCLLAATFTMGGADYCQAKKIIFVSLFENLSKVKGGAEPIPAISRSMEN